MEEQAKQAILDTGLIIPKQEIIEDVEVTFENDCEDSKEFIVPKEELSNSSLHLEEEYEPNVMPIKTETTLSKEISQIRNQQGVSEQGETPGYVEIKSPRRRQAPLYVDTERVIGEVRRRPALWDLAHKLYKDRDARAELWTQVFQELFPDYFNIGEHRKKEIEKMVQQRWKTARDAYIRCRNILKNNSQSDSGRKKVYVYFDDMRFLDKKHALQDDIADSCQAVPSASHPDAASKSNHDAQRTTNRYTATTNRDTPTSNRYTSMTNRDTLASNCATPMTNRDTSVSNRDTSTSNCDTSTSNRDTSTSNRDKTTPNRDTYKSNCETQTSFHDTQTTSNRRPSATNCDTSNVYDTPGTSNNDTGMTNNETQSKTNQDSVPSKSLNLNARIVSQPSVLAKNPPNNDYSNPNKRFKKGQKKRKQASSDDFEKEMLLMFKEHAKLMQNDDLTFFMSLLPITKTFTNHQKLVFRSEILKKAMEIENMNNPYETSRPDSSHT